MSEGRRTVARWPVMLLLLYLLVYIFPLGVRPLAIPDETRYAEIPREMLASNDWVTPRLNGLRYFEKPPLGYWLNATSIALLGENNFAVRFPSALAAGLTALLVFWLARRLTGDRRTALIAAVIQLTFMEVYVVGVMALLDNFVTLFLTAGIVAFYFGVEGGGRRLMWWLSGIAFGCAFLAKGFLAFAIPVLVLAPWMLWQGRWRMLWRGGGQAAIAALLTALPWAVLIHWREGDFWHYFFWVEHIKRFTAENAQHKAPPWYFLAYLPLLAFPWFMLFPAAVTGLRPARQERQRHTLRLLWLWFLLPFAFFSASSGKLATYILPCFPPLAVLFAVGLDHYLKGGGVALFRGGVLLNLMLFLGGLILLVVSQTGNVGFRAYAPDETARLAALIGALVLGITGWWSALRGANPDARLMPSVLAMLPLFFVIHFSLPEQVRQRIMPGPFLDQFRDRVSDDTVLVTDNSVVRAVDWYFKRDDAFLIGQGELAYGLSYPDAAQRYLDSDAFDALLRTRGLRDGLFMLCKGPCGKAYVQRLPERAERQIYGKFHAWYLPPRIQGSP